MKYQQLSLPESIELQVANLRGLGVRAIARLMGRAPATISRELRRNISSDTGEYRASYAQQLAQTRHQACRPMQKLALNSERFTLVVEMLRERLSPEQIAAELPLMHPNCPTNYVCRETIYTAIYALPVDELRKDCQRQGNKTGRPRSDGVDRRNKIPDMMSIHLHPPEVSERILHGH